jgi:hypothetical protein
MEHVTKLFLVATGPREAFTIGSSERADKRVAVLAADLAGFVAMSGVDCHSELQISNLCGPGRLGAGGLGGSTGPGAVIRGAPFGKRGGLRIVPRLMGAALCLPITRNLFELSRFVIADHSAQRCVLCQNVAKPLVISTAFCKAGADSFS